MTLITMLEIQTNGDNIVCDVSGPDQDNKYAGWISLFRNGDFHKHLINTDQIYNSSHEAKSVVEDIVRKIRSIENK